jgi:segregation and condensation protein A
MNESNFGESQHISSALYEVKLGDVFEGPMDLLIYLIKKNEVNIYDIPIALITRQYLEYIEWMKSLNIDLAGDFLLMAATLAQIKSRMLLPVPELDEDQEDPRMEITRPLLEYLQMKSAAEELAYRNILGSETFIRQIPDKNFHKEFTATTEDQIIHVGLFELIDAFRRILDTLPGEDHVDFTTDRVTVTDKITEIVDILEKKGSVTFTELFSPSSDKTDIIVTFLAILEMVKLYLIRIVQHIHTGTIRIFYL